MAATPPKGGLKACAEIVFGTATEVVREPQLFAQACKSLRRKTRFRATKPGFRGYSPCDLNKGDRNVQSEPKSRPAKSEPRTEAGPAARRRPEARTAAAG